MKRLAAALCVATVSLASAAAADARPADGPAASAVVLQATDVPGAKVVRQKGASLGGGVSQYLREFALASPYGASKYVVLENIAVVVPDAAVGAQVFGAVARSFSTAKARRTLETGLAKVAFVAKKTKTKSKTPAAKIVFTHESTHALALGERGVEISFTASVGKRHLDTSVTIFQIGQVIEELIASGTAPQTVEKDTLALGTLVLGRADAASLPVATTPPTITGTAQQGQTLSAGPGGWKNGPTGYTYQWQHCDAAGANCADVAGATGSTYAVTSADVGTTIRVDVGASNAFGASAAPASSAVTAVVT